MSAAKVSKVWTRLWLPLWLVLGITALVMVFQSQAAPAGAQNQTQAGVSLAPAAPASAPLAPVPEIAAAASSKSDASWIKYLAAALAVGLACLGGGIAVGRIGAAAMGAMSEKPELAGKAMPFAGLAEGICLWGFLVAMLILFL